MFTQPLHSHQPRKVRIGTRKSPLALFQTYQVQNHLDTKGVATELIPIQSEGDINYTTPLYEMGVQGIFTKALDHSLLSNEIDIAVHSYKDVPTCLAKGLSVVAVLKRTLVHDMLIGGENFSIEMLNMPNRQPYTVATGSLRRRAQWLYRYPNDCFKPLRGNIQTRLQKLKTNNWQGAIFSSVAIERLGITEKESGKQIILDWMVPAPAQGAIVVIARSDDQYVHDICNSLDDTETNMATQLERAFMRQLEAGCSTPVGALATINNQTVNFLVNVTATDGKKQIAFQLTDTIGKIKYLADEATKMMFEQGVDKILKR
ncbi:MAG: hydroxymethylbilane synthase [Phycisphaerales bacterium]|nr:hydroxymethylbilane synthase [Phycisphaerales bacterium]